MSATSGRHIYGILAPPRVSRNRNLYLPEQLAMGDGKVIDFFDQHEDFEMGPDGRPTGRILGPQDGVVPRGQIKLNWNEEFQRLEYDGVVWDKNLIDLIKAGKRPYVSLAAEPQRVGLYQGYKVPMGLNFFSAASVDNPGIPETTLNMERMTLEKFVELPVSERLQTRYVLCEGNLEAELDADARDKLPASKFAAPAKGDDGDDKLPMPDRAHAINAKARFNQTHFDSPDQKKKAFDRVNAALKKFGLEPMEELYGGADPSGTTSYEEEMPALMEPPYVPPQSGTLPSGGHDILKKVYVDLRKGGSDQASAAKQAWGAVKNAGYSQDQSGQWNKKEEENPKLQQFPPPTQQPQSPVQLALAKQNNQSGQSGPGWPTGVAPGVVGVSQDPHLGGTGAVGVSGTSNITPMAGDGTNPPIPANAPVPRPSNPWLSANKGRSADSWSEMSTAPAVVGEEAGATGDVSSAEEKETTLGHKVDVKAIGAEETPYEKLRTAIMTGKATQQEAALFAQFTPEKYVPIGDLGTAASVGNRVSSIPAREEEEEEEDPDKKKPDAEEKMLSYGYTKETLESTFNWSTLSKRERELVAKSLREAKLAGVRNPTATKTARTAPLGSPAGAFVVNGVDLSFPDVEKHLENLAMTEQTGEVKHLYSRVAFLSPPRIETGQTALEKRLGWVNAIESYTETKRTLMMEAIATTTTGAAMGVQANAPALIVPTNLAAVMRDTVYFQQVMQGFNTARFQTVTVPSAVALTQNTEPSQSSQTLAAVDIAPTPRGVEQQISFEAERKIMGPILEAVILSFRLSELYDEDYLLIGGSNTQNYSGASSQAFETGVVTGSTGVYGTTNQLFGNARATEAAVISTDTMSVQIMDDAVAQIQIQGYATDNLVTVMFPQQYRKLLIDANALRLVSFGPGFDQTRSMLAQGVIPELIGSELRRSTLGNTGTGSASITTFHAWMYKKGQTVAMAASRDLIIETFRDVRVNSTWVKGHWDLKANLLHPNSLIEMVTA